MTLCPSPPCIKCALTKQDKMVNVVEQKDVRVNHASVCNDSYIVHMKYTLLPPFPLFIPSIQLKLENAILLNTVDSVLAITVNQETKHKRQDFAWKFQLNDQVINQHSQPLWTDRGNGVHYPEHDGLINRCTELQIVKEEERRSLSNGDSNTIKLMNNNHELLVSCKEKAFNHSKLSHLSSFGHKTFCSNCPDLERAQNPCGVIDGTSLDIQVTNVHNILFKLTQSLPYNNVERTDQGCTPVHELPCVHTQVVSLDVERYISEALNTSDDLKGMYPSLRNYSTQIVDVCHRSQRVILQVVSLISVQPKAERITRLVSLRSNFSFV